MIHIPKHYGFRSDPRWVEVACTTKFYPAVTLFLSCFCSSVHFPDKMYSLSLVRFHRHLNLRDDTSALSFHRVDGVVTKFIISTIEAVATSTRGVAGQIALAGGIRRLPVQSRTWRMKQETLFKKIKKNKKENCGSRYSLILKLE